MPDREQRELAAELTGEVIGQQAPDESVLFDAISESYVRADSGKRTGRGGRDEMLGFGVGEAAAMLGV